ncbi:MAG: DNA methyltransferase, partial [Armatimonadota bacterium]
MGSLKNGDINNLLQSDAPIHNWYRFVLSFPPHLVRQYLDKFGAGRNSRVLDPFCGTGTTPVECKKKGIPSVGIEVNHIAYFASKVKVAWCIDPDAFLEDCHSVAEVAIEKIERGAIIRHADAALSVAEDSPEIQLRDLTIDQWGVLPREFISPVPLHKALCLLDVIRSREKKPWSEHQELAMAKSLVSGIGNIAFKPEVSATQPKSDAPVIDLWLNECKRMCQDLQEVDSRLLGVEANILQTDARITLPITDANVDIVITSPPYPNEKDYTRTTRLESVVLGLIRSRKDLRDLKTNLLNSNTRNIFATDDVQRVCRCGTVIQLAKQIEDRRIELGKTSGFERLYHRVVLQYFRGMEQHFEVMKRVLKPGACLAYVVGDQMSYFRILIRTGQILAEIAESLGYRVDSIDLWRTRLATA